MSPWPIFSYTRGKFSLSSSLQFCSGRREGEHSERPSKGEKESERSGVDLAILDIWYGGGESALNGFPFPTWKVNPTVGSESDDMT